MLIQLLTMSSITS